MGFPLGKPGDIEAINLQDKLIDEEYDELKSATDNENELKEMADLVFVIFQAAALRGWDLDEALHRVFLSNMSKLDDNGQPIRRADGKILKGPNYEPLNLMYLV